MRVLSLLAVMLLLAGTVFACGGGGNKGPVDLNAVPTATLPDPLPPIVIVGQTSGPTGSGDGRTYTVVDGDTLLDIANRYNVSVEDLMAINNLTDPTALFVDQVLTIPGTSGSSTPQRASTPTTAPAEEPTEAPTVAPTEPASGQTYTVQEGDIPETIAAQFGITADALMAANGLTDPTSLQIGQVLVIPAPSP